MEIQTKHMTYACDSREYKVTIPEEAFLDKNHATQNDERVWTDTRCGNV